MQKKILRHFVKHKVYKNFELFLAKWTFRFHNQEFYADFEKRNVGSGSAIKRKDGTGSGSALW
jgi:hypothetical protein